MHSIKNLIYIALVTILLFAHLTVAQDAQKRNSLLAKRAGNNKNIFQKTTTTTPEPVYEDEEAYPEEPIDDADYHDHEQSSTTTTTTEAPKKMIRPSVRPMRSNEDLLSALKKRRISEKNKPKEVVTQKPVQEERQFEPEVKPVKPKVTSAPISSSNNRRFGGHKSTNVKAPVSDNHAQNIEEQPTKSFRSPNRFARSK
ncbi:uncharacterized protein [Chironomus tepperi]|uniref:uncharacterized protein n=1 Tax=Chironomus tepperi TaxID=113505 RepID=UPI00391F277F